MSKYVFFLIFAFCAYPVSAQTYTTIADGNWNSASTWLGGSIPPTASDIPATAVINIRHSVIYNTGNPLKNRGELRIQPVGGSSAVLTVPTGINVEIYSTGSFYVVSGSYIQCRFVTCNDGQPYSGTNPGAPIQSGTFKNIGGYNEARNAYIEIAQDWTNESGGNRFIIDSCIKTGQNFSTSGAASTDTITRSQVSVGWHASGNFQLADGTALYSQFRVQVAGTSGSFKLDSGTANGDIDAVQLLNEIASFQGSGEVSASSSLNVTTLNLDSYCVSNPSKYIPNGKFSGSQTPLCSEPNLACSTLPFTAANVSVDGRVVSSNGRGIKNAVVELVGGNLSQPMRVMTSSFGYFRFEEVPAGSTYVVTVSAKRFVFGEPSQVISLHDNVTGIEFIALASRTTYSVLRK